jgi:hypothetical protein
VATIAFSAIAFAGPSQCAALAVLADGGGGTFGRHKDLVLDARAAAFAAAAAALAARLSVIWAIGAAAAAAALVRLMTRTIGQFHPL